MTTSAEAFLQALLRAMPTPQAQTALLLEVQKWEGVTLYLPMQSKAARRARAALNMLDNQMSPADVATALQERFGVCERTAWRDVAIARKKSASDVSTMT